MKNIKTDLISIVSDAEKTFKLAATEAAKIYSNPDLTDEAKYNRAAALSEWLNAEVARLHDKVEQAEKAAIDDLERAKKFNSDRRLTNSAYQDSVIRTAEFIIHIPDTLGQSAIEKRLWPFYGDDLAREYLSSIAEGISNERKQRGVEGFNVNDLFFDVYALQNAAVYKIAESIVNRLYLTLSKFTTATKSDVETTENEKAMIFMEGYLTGIREYFDSIPAELHRPAKANDTDFETIPCYAEKPDDLDVNFIWYRKPEPKPEPEPTHKHPRLYF